MQMLRFSQRPLAKFAHRFLHRIEGIGRAGENAVLDSLMHRFGQDRVPAIEVVKLAARIDSPDAHAVFRQRTGLVHAKHRRSSKGFDGRQPPRQHVVARNPPCADGQKDEQHHWKLLRQGRHGERQSGKQAVEPVVAREAVSHRHDHAERDAVEADRPHDTAHLLLKQPLLRLHVTKRRADHAYAGARTGFHHLSHAAPLDHERAGKDA